MSLKSSLQGFEVEWIFAMNTLLLYQTIRKIYFDEKLFYRAGCIFYEGSARRILA